MAKDFLPRLTPSEFEIMDVIWQAEELTSTEIVNRVNSVKEKKLKRTTIQVQIARLEEKGWLTHRGEGKKFFYRATVPRGEASASITADIKERIFGGSCLELVKSLFAGSNISSDDIKKLREFIDKYED